MSPLEEFEQDLAAIEPSYLEYMKESLELVGQGEEVLGIAPPRAQRLLAVAHQYVRKCHGCLVSAVAAVAIEEKEELATQARRYKAMMQLATVTTWIEVRDLFGARAWSASAIGMRKGSEGLVIVIYKDPDSPQLQILEVFREVLEASDEDDSEVVH